MRRINYKSDIPPLLLSLKVDENQITVPDCDFIVRFYIEGYEGRHYDCSHIGGVWSNCEPSEDGTKLVCYINNQRLGIGELCAEFHYISPDSRYSDGSQKSVVIIGSTELGVELVEDNGDAVTEAAIDVTLPFIYRTAYEIARDHGYTGTAEDFYSALASVVGIADAEKKRVSAEITRNANEQERIENEENRLNAENERVNAEVQRVRYEAIRCDAESDRVEQEEDRKAKFEEITGFIATVRANEGNRESNELERQTNEDTRITEEAKRVEAEKKRAAEFEQQKLDLSGKIDRSGDEMGGDLIFTDNAGVTFRTSDGGDHSLFNDTDDVAKFTADNGDTFEFKQNETPNKNSSAVVVSANLYDALDMTLDSMGSALDGDAAYRAEAGDKIFNPDTFKIQRYNSTVGGFEDLCDPIDGKLYANKMTDYIYRWNTKAKKMVFVGGVKAYTKEEADSRFAKLDDATQVVKVKELEANNFVSAKSMWIGDEGLLLGGDGNGHLTVEQDEVITDVTLNEKLATKADDVAYMVDFNNPNNIEKTGTVKEATQSLVVAAGFLLIGDEQVKEELNSKIDKELHVVLASMGNTLDNVDNAGGPTIAYVANVGDIYYSEGEKHLFYKKSETETIDLGEPNDKKIYANAMTKRLYIWIGGTWRQCGTAPQETKESIEEKLGAWLEDDGGEADGEVYTKAESDALFSGKVSKTDITQSTGTSTTAVMSQKAVSDAIAVEETRAKESEENLDNKVTDLEARMVDSSAHIGDDDKKILNQPLLDLIGTDGVDYTVIENMKFSSWNGNIVAATGNYLILVTMKKSILSYRGLTISGYKGWWTADVKPSASNPNVDDDGNDVTYTKGYYYSGSRSNVSVAKPYLLFDAGTDITNFVMAYLSFIPAPIYDIKSLNGGIRIVSSSIDGVGDKTMQLLKQGIATKHNSLDTTCVLNGMNFSNKSPFSLSDAEGSIYCQPIPIGAKNVLVRGLRGTETYTYHRIFVLDENLIILANDNHSGADVANQYVSLENVTGAKYLAFNASGAEVASAIDEVLVLYDVPIDYNYWLAYNNYFDGEKAMLDIPYETSGIKNCMTYANLILKSNNVFDFLCEGITERYATFIFPDGSVDDTADTLVQYDENDNVLKSESLYNAAKTNFGKSNTTLVQIRLVEGCVKLKYRFVSKIELQSLSLEELIARGNKVILSNRTVEWGNNLVKSINGIPLNINAYSPLKGKLICCMGDSITDFGSSSANGSWAWYIQRNYDCGVANYGRGSAHFCDVADTDPTADTNPGSFSTSTTPNNVVSTQVRWCIRELTADNITPDAIVLTGLTNDAFGTVNLGELDTALASYPMTADEVHTDFYGAAVYMVSKLRTAWPQVKILFATPPRSLNPTQMQRLVQYVEAMRNVAKALGCGVIDFFDESLVEYPKATYNASTETWAHDNPMYNTNDILHPSQLGVNIMGQLAYAKLIEYLQ